MDTKRNKRLRRKLIDALVQHEEFRDLISELGCSFVLYDPDRTGECVAVRVWAAVGEERKSFNSIYRYSDLSEMEEDSWAKIAGAMVSQWKGIQNGKV